MDSETNKNEEQPNGGFIPIYKKQFKLKTHKPTSGLKKNLVSIMDIFNMNAQKN